MACRGSGRGRFLIVWLWLGISPGTIWGVDVPRMQAELADQLDPLIGSYRGQVAIFIRHLPSGAEFAYKADEPMPTASLIKLPIMVASYERAAVGQLDLKKRVTFRETDRTPGSGILSQQFSDGLELSLRDAIRLMIAYSDNAATNLVLRELGISAVNETMGKMACPQTRLHAFVYRPETSVSPPDSQKWGLGKTTARETAKLLEQIQTGQLINPDLSREMLEHLLAADDRQRLGLHLPAGTKIALKTGAVTAHRTVAGIIETPSGPLVVCILTAENKDRRWTEDNAAYRLAADVAKVAWSVVDGASKEPPPSDHQGLLKLGSQGLLVEDLQRTLNSRMTPSPQITVDGDFGPQTETALKGFQKVHQLAETGRTDAATWKKLGPLVAAATSDDGEAAPASPAALLPADSLDGPPVVTSKAWVVGDPTAGTILGGHAAEEPRDFASTTKIMTLYVVLKLAEQQPQVLDELVLISREVDQTPGSTAGVREGEQLRVRDLLDGLMLPSGNDAAVALAIHFGPRLADAAKTPASSPMQAFVDAMNRTAAEVGMTHTRYSNPHGLTEAQHRSSVQDQFRLVSAALKRPLFREVVCTRHRTCVVSGPGGYQREVVWTNTNRLLNHEGFQGVKTGTTSAAGACLVTLDVREGREAVAVVFGATSSDARYVDTRNLLRWYWQSIRK